MIVNYNTEIFLILSSSSGIDFLEELVEDSRKGLQKSFGEMFYCYQARYSKTNTKLEVSTHTRDHVIADMTHSSFIISAEIKVKGKRPKVQ